MLREAYWVGLLVPPGLGMLSLACSLRELDDLEAPSASECDPVLQARCARAGASCDRVPDLLGAPTTLCRWEDADSELPCSGTLLGSWTAVHSPWAVEHPGSVASGASGACISEPPVSALPASVELCFEFQAAFLANGGDLPLPGENEPARGVRFHITDAAGVKSQYDADPVTGCATLELDGFARYEVTLLAWVSLADGNQIRLAADDAEPGPYRWRATDSLVPSALDAARLRYVWPALPPEGATPHISTLMAALVRSLQTHTLTTDQSYRAYLGGSTCRLPCVQTDSAGIPSLFFPDGRTDKFAISNMVAQLGTQLRLGGDIGSAGGDLPDCALADPAASRCANGATHVAGSTEFTLGTEEYGNCAFLHGWTHYVASSIWNRPEEPDCDYKQHGPLGDCYEPGSAAAYCYAGAEPSLPGIGFERDWLTALWALERFDGCGIPFAVIADIVVAANPRAWGNGSAKSALIQAAPAHLSRSALDCFEATLATRIVP